MKSAPRVALALLLILIAQPVLADCRFMIVDVATAEYDLPDGTHVKSVTEYWGWVCSCCLQPVWGDPYPPGYYWPPPPPPVEPTPTPVPVPQPPPAPTGCSISACLRECAGAYLRDAGVEVIAGTYVQHAIDFECGRECQDLERLEYDACRAGCSTDCNMPVRGSSVR